MAPSQRLAALRPLGTRIRSGLAHNHWRPHPTWPRSAALALSVWTAALAHSGTPYLPWPRSRVMALPRALAALGSHGTLAGPGRARQSRYAPSGRLLAHVPQRPAAVPRRPVGDLQLVPVVGPRRLVL